MRTFTLSFLMVLYCANLSFAQSPCSPAKARVDLDINNIRSRINQGGDYWWDKSDPKFEVPKGSGKNALFCGGIWIGGLDQNNNLHVSAQTYRQSGVDFYAGPLDTVNGATDSTKCAIYDKIWKINQSDVLNFKNGGTATNDILSWPGNGNPNLNVSKNLAPFYDANSDGKYNPKDGDYPALAELVPSSYNNEKLYGDQLLWWVLNDARPNGASGESGGTPMGFEFQFTAFAFNAPTTDPINNTQFYSVKIINRNSNTYHDVALGLFTDGDLGNYSDDYVGCDVGRNVAFYYNGDNDDDGPKGYGLNPPVVGIDILSGPIAKANDGIDNNNNGQVDEIGEKCLMSSFMYYNNDKTIQGPPSAPQHYYNYITGLWKDNAPLTYGGNGKGGGLGASNLAVNYMFSGTTDPKANGQNWTETSAGNVPADRRFIQGCGKFDMAPGAVKSITYSVLYSRLGTGSINDGINHFKKENDEIQAFFNSNFSRTTGLGKEINVLNLNTYPNPFSTELNINVPSNLISNFYEISIYNISGQLVKTEKGIANSIINLSTENLEHGNYMVKMNIGKQIFENKIFKY